MLRRLAFNLPSQSRNLSTMLPPSSTQLAFVPFSCPLCTTEITTPPTPLHTSKKTPARPYVSCSTCELVFVPPAFYISKEAEAERYKLHENDPADEGYQNFLMKLTTPLQELLIEKKWKDLCVPSSSSS